MCEYHYETLLYLLLNLTLFPVVTVNDIIEYLPVMMSKTITYSNEDQKDDDYDELCTCRDYCSCNNRKLVRRSVFILMYPIRWEYSDEYLIDFLNSKSNYTLLYVHNHGSFKTNMENKMILNEKDTDPDDHTDYDCNCSLVFLSQENWSA